MELSGGKREVGFLVLWERARSVGGRGGGERDGDGRSGRTGVVDRDVDGDMGREEMLESEEIGDEDVDGA